MVENLETINLIDKKFKLIQRKSEKFIYQYFDKELEEISILELEFSKEEQRIKKIDIFMIHDEEVIESLHIIRGTDGITEIDYYPTEVQNINIDGNTELYNINLFKLYKEENTKIYEESLDLELIKKGHKKHKTLTKIPVVNNLYGTKDNRYHRVTSYSISKFNHLTEFLLPSIQDLEKNLFESQAIEIEEENQMIYQGIIEKVETEYPQSLFVYDRNYDFIGIKEGTLIYRNMQEGILDLEVHFDNKKQNIKEIRFINYQEIEIEGIKNISKRKITRINVIGDNKVMASLVNRKKESLLINNHAVEKALLKATAIVEETESEKTVIQELNLNIGSPAGNFELQKSPIRKMNFVDKEGQEFIILSSSYVFFRMLISYGPGLVRLLEEKLIFDIQETKKEEKILVKK